MKKQIFAWKNGKQTAERQEWEEITTNDLSRICKENQIKPRNQRRYFARIPGVEENDSYYVLECDYKNYLKSVAEAMERWRKRIEEEKLIEEGLVFEIVSLDLSMTDENGESYTLLDMIPDPDSIFEDKVVASMDLHKALLSLSDEERHLIDVFYLSSHPKTVREYAEEISVSFTTIQSRKEKILKKLKDYFVQN